MSHVRVFYNCASGLCARVYEIVRVIEFVWQCMYLCEDVVWLNLCVCMCVS